MLDHAGRIAVLAHLIDFDDLHIPTTTHSSAVCVLAAIATGSGAEAYLSGAGVMARLGAIPVGALRGGWHATCTAGAPAAAVALGLDAVGIESAIALAVLAAGRVNRAFGTIAKSPHLGFAVHAGVRAARLAGARADGAVVPQWLALVGGTALPQPSEPSIPARLAFKVFRCRSKLLGQSERSPTRSASGVSRRAMFRRSCCAPHSLPCAASSIHVQRPDSKGSSASNTELPR